MSSLTYSRIPPLRSSLQGLEKPFSESWALGKESFEALFLIVVECLHI